MKQFIILLNLLFLAISAQSQITIRDMFGRVLNERGISLVDWDGHLMNPMVELSLSPPSNATFPFTLSLFATGTSRLMLDSPSSLSSLGARKSIVFNNNSSVVIKLAIAPDRRGGYGEIEEYELKIGYNRISQSIKINVLDLDKDFEPTLPIVFDYRKDDINYLFNKDEFRLPSEMAVKDWFYFFDYTAFDEVPAGAERTSLPGNNWTNHVQLANNEPYSGYWVFTRSIDEPYSTGYPTNNRKNPTINGTIVPGIPRSSNLILQDNPRANWSLSTKGEDWYKTNPYTVDDVYGVVMHELGHAIVFHNWIPGFQEYSKHPEQATRVVQYQDTVVPVAGSGHLVGDRRSWDRLSGHSAGYSGVFPPRRWMLTKLTLLIAEEIGWKLRKLGPFINPEMTTDSLWDGVINKPYYQQIKTNFGGVPIYDFTVIQGALPNGLTLDRFTGEITGIADDNIGSYTFTVRLKDGDKLNDPVDKQFTLNLTSCAAPSSITVSNITESSAIVTWSDTSAELYLVKYRTKDKSWQTALEVTDTTFQITGLIGNTEYEVSITSRCSDDDINRNITFTTRKNIVASIINTTNKNAPGINLYPNPAKDIITIKNLAKDDSYTIYSIQGTFLLRGTKETIDISNLSSGLYLIKTNNQYLLFVKQ